MPEYKTGHVRVRSFMFFGGLTGRKIIATTDSRLARTEIRGLPYKRIRSTLSRLERAIEVSGFQLPTRPQRIEIYPRVEKGMAGHLDLALAAAILVSTGQLPRVIGDRTVLYGRVGHDGSIQGGCENEPSLTIKGMRHRDEEWHLIGPARDAALMPVNRLWTHSSIEQLEDLIEVAELLDPTEILVSS